MPESSDRPSVRSLITERYQVSDASTPRGRFLANLAEVIAWFDAHGDLPIPQHATFVAVVDTGTELAELARKNAAHLYGPDDAKQFHLPIVDVPGGSPATLYVARTAILP